MKIHNSQGNLYYICPFLDKINEVIGKSCNQKKPLSIEEVFEISRHLDSIREIAKSLRGEDNVKGDLNLEIIHKPYNFSAALRSLKSESKTKCLDSSMFDEILKRFL